LRGREKIGEAVDNTDILIKIRKIVRSINLESKKILKDYGVSIPQVLCLNFLRNSHGFRATQKDLSSFMNLNPSTVTGIINRLETKGYIARLPKSDDRRKTYITLTSKASSLLDKIPPLLHERLSENLKTLSPGDAERIGSALDLLINYLDIDYIEASPVITFDDEIIEESK
jgi:DNA-binding MarR family transcriptional regulator